MFNRVSIISFFVCCVIGFIGYYVANNINPYPEYNGVCVKYEETVVVRTPLEGAFIGYLITGGLGGALLGAIIDGGGEKKVKKCVQWDRKINSDYQKWENEHRKISKSN